MSRRFAFVTVVLVAAGSFLVGLIVAGSLTPAPAASRTNRPAVGTASVAHVSSAPALVNFADIAEHLNPAVVNIDATSINDTPERETTERNGYVHPWEARPHDVDTPLRGTGSGVFIEPDGHILTNYHVIQRADRITVKLADGRTLRAHVVGSDPDTDLALIKVEGSQPFPAAALGDSDTLRVGEWVCAIGNPLAYEHTVTVGVVSYIGRKLFDKSLDNYIQTDAAINFGNSGGPLINTRGEVVGINAAVSPRTSSIGFAVPINQAVAVLPQLKSTGRVARGFIGVTLTDVTPALQRALGLTVSRGAVVQDISVNSPAERADLRPYDVVIDVDGHPVESNEELIHEIAARAPGTVARLSILRDGRHQLLMVKLAERPRRGEEFGGVAPPPDGGTPRPADASLRSPLGITVRELDRTFPGRVEVPEQVKGVVIRAVDQAGPSYAVLRRGLVIMEINRRETASLAAYEKIVTAARPGDVMAIYFYDPTQGQRSLVTVTVE